MPYRTTNNIIDGLVVTFTHIHKLKTAYEKIQKLNIDIELARQYSENIVDTVRDSLLILNKDLKVLSANRSFYKMFNTVSEKTVGKFIYELDNNNWDIFELRNLLEEIIPERSFFEDFEIGYNFSNKGKKKLLLNARQIFQGKKETKLILLAIEYHDIK
jgi:nitrogen fixation/metabolism regulation signal transduction histidine kinase